MQRVLRRVSGLMPRPITQLLALVGAGKADVDSKERPDCKRQQVLVNARGMRLKLRISKEQELAGQPRTSLQEMLGTDRRD